MYDQALYPRSFASRHYNQNFFSQPMRQYLSHLQWVQRDISNRSKRAPSRTKTISFPTFIARYNQHYDLKLNYRDPALENDRYSLSAERTYRRLLERPRQCLWLTVTMSAQKIAKSTVRRWCIRRTKHALMEAMRVRDLGTQEGSSAISTAALLGQPSLSGSLRLSLTDRALTAAFSDIQKEAGILLDNLLKDNR